MAWTTPKTWVDNVDVLSATNLNTHLRDNLNAATGWTSYSPTWGATTTAPNLSNGTLTGHRTSGGGLCHILLYVQWGSTTTGGSGGWTFTMPTTCIGPAVGSAFMFDSSTAAIEVGVAYAGPSESTVKVRYVSSATAGNVQGTAPWTWASGDYLAVSLTYRTA